MLSEVRRIGLYQGIFLLIDSVLQVQIPRLCGVSSDFVRRGREAAKWKGVPQVCDERLQMDFLCRSRRSCRQFWTCVVPAGQKEQSGKGHQQYQHRPLLRFVVEFIVGLY